MKCKSFEYCNRLSPREDRYQVHTLICIHDRNGLRSYCTLIRTFVERLPLTLITATILENTKYVGLSRMKATKLFVKV